jgi:hypothetical protein
MNDFRQLQVRAVSCQACDLRIVLPFAVPVAAAWMRQPFWHGLNASDCGGQLSFEVLPALQTFRDVGELINWQCDEWMKEHGQSTFSSVLHGIGVTSPWRPGTKIAET